MSLVELCPPLELVDLLSCEAVDPHLTPLAFGAWLGTVAGPPPPLYLTFLFSLVVGITGPALGS